MRWPTSGRDIRRVAVACGVPEHGEEAVADLQAKMQRISERACATSRRPSVACIEWHEPLMAAGNWVPELVEMAGAVNLFGQAGTAFAVDELAATCGRRSRTSSSACPAASTWIAPAPKCIGSPTGRNGRNCAPSKRARFTWPTAINTSIDPAREWWSRCEILAEILHPEVFEPTLEGMAWRAHCRMLSSDGYKKKR